MSGAELFLAIAICYLGVGWIFGVVFVTIGVARFDPAAHGTSPVFRLLILPGSVTLWPILAMIWIRRGANNS